MIENPPLLTIRGGFARPAAEQVAALRGVPTGQLVDALGGRAALDYRIKPVSPNPTRVRGVALTCACGPADNLAVFAALAEARPGDVIVAATDAFTGTAVIGDLLLGMLKNRDVAGFVTDGLARDLDGVEAVGLPLFCRGISPDSPARNGPGSVGQPVTLGGTTVASGDVVVGDRDGVVVVPQARLPGLAERLDAVRAAERELEAKVEAGLELPDFVQDLLGSSRVRRLE